MGLNARSPTVSRTMSWSRGCSSNRPLL